MKPTKAQEAMAHIWGAILTRQLTVTPNAHGHYSLTVATLCEQLDLTTATARDGLHLLAMAGRISYQPHLGYQLMPLSQPDWQPLAAGIQAMVGAFMDRLPPRLDEPTSLTLLGLLHSLQHLPAKDYRDLAALAHWHQQLHYTLFAGINPYLADAIQPLVAQHLRYLTHPDIGFEFASSWQRLMPVLRGLVSARPQAHSHAYQHYWLGLNTAVGERLSTFTSGQFL
ncbi:MULTISPECIES: hypothetical protein [Salinivibrio]|uniref:Transcriptional regulator n=1 Tax=Salinivibrio kushneri TaxID=1908198 RepID=A0AB36K7J1_9GAMM|nr:MULTISPECIES: hypothetical protein [Salinivibrio]OOE35675.1 hypothetical protein BZG05_04500 [Salinivibrio kushneri]OOE37536.1 hypothetical protein BZG04_03740 [Salinivibrio kushneri]OOE44514.1 hypothetical protein BZG09_07575 [Salinivibrio kushneri]OOE44661.1 hypothetical protein BZG06_09010 [Salinivibrio kushneri]OOE53120.1 hypothetical protein BZG11_02750 [Salinivibrio kushneri]